MFGTVGSDMYILKQDELSELGVGERRDWHDDVDKLLAVISKEMAKEEIIAETALEPDPKVTEEELVRRAFFRLQSLLNEHNCGAGRPDGILGPRTEAAFQRFVDATGVSIDFDAENAFERVINVLDSTKRPACAGFIETKPAPKKPAMSDPALLTGDWAVLQRCNDSGNTRISRAQVTLTNARISAGKALYDMYMINELKDSFQGALTEWFGKSSAQISFVVDGSAANKHYRDRIFVSGADLNGSRDSIKATNINFVKGRPQGVCTIDAYKVKY